MQTTPGYRKVYTSQSGDISAFCLDPDRDVKIGSFRGFNGIKFVNKNDVMDTLFVLDESLNMVKIKETDNLEVEFDVIDKQNLASSDFAPKLDKI